MPSKNCLNPACGKKFTPNSGKQKYCSSKCKVAHSRVHKGAVLFKEGVLTVKKGSRVDEFFSGHPNNKNNMGNLPDENTDLGKRFKEVCKLKKVSPEDALVWFEENYSKLPSFLKKAKPDSGKKETPVARGGSDYLAARRKMKGM